MRFFNNSSGLPSSNLDSDELAETRFPSNLNQACLATIFSLKKLLDDVNLYKLVDFIEGLYLAVFVYHGQSPVVA